jgi:hypothetical protein
VLHATLHKARCSCPRRPWSRECLPCPADWRDALTAQQSLAWATCTHALHPRSADRLTAKAVWRGSTTDKHHHHTTLSSFLSLGRTKVRERRE